MRVVIDARTATDHFPGIGRYVANLCRALGKDAASGDLELALLSDSAAPATRLALPDLPTASCPVSPFALSQQWRVPAALARLGACIYHSPYYLMPYMPRVPTVVTCYDVIPLACPAGYTGTQRWIFRFAHLLALRTARVILAISESTRSDLVRWFGADPKRIVVTPLAADPAFRPPTAAQVDTLRQKFALPEDYVLYFGSNKPHKNIAQLVAAWAQLHQMKGRSAPGGDAGRLAPILVVAGHWDPRFPEARELVEDLNIGSTVRFLGPVPEVELPALYGGATCFVFPSRYEGFGLPVLEAMACGTPVICSNTSSLPEIAGDAALLVDPASVTSLAEAMEAVLTSPGVRADLSRRGLLRAGEFSWERTARQTAAAYASVAAQRA